MAENKDRTWTPNELYEVLRGSWSVESGGKWLPSNPARGQCSVTALLVQDVLGGDILKTDVDGAWHFYNRIVGRRWDFTASQFEKPISYQDFPSGRKEAFSDTSLEKYQLLRCRVLAATRLDLRVVPMTLPRIPKAVIFDMDGLLFDTERLYQEALYLASAEGGHEVAPDFFTRTIGLPKAQCRALLLSHFGETFAVDAFHAAWIRHFWVIAETRLALKPGALELLDTLDQFRLPRAIATSSSRQTVERHLIAHNLTGRFDTLVVRGDYAAGKPAPDPFLTAAERLGITPADCVALEDSHNGVRSAAAAGMMTVMVPDLLQPTDEIRACCHSVVADLHAVRHLLLARAGT